MKLLRDCSRYYVYEGSSSYYIREAHETETTEKIPKNGSYHNTLPPWYCEAIILNTVHPSNLGTDIPLKGKKYNSFTYNWVVIPK